MSMHLRGIEWDSAEPSASGSPHYLAGDYNGVTIEMHYREGEWHWTFYDARSTDPQTPVATGSEEDFGAAVRKVKDYIDGYRQR